MADACWILSTSLCRTQISVEAFRVMTESFGMQLDDDSLLALFSRARAAPAYAIFCRTMLYVLALSQAGR